MATRRPLSRNNNHLEEAMALLIRNQAAFVEQIARNDQERLRLQRNFEEGQLENKEWQRKAEARFDRIEATLAEMPKTILRSALKQLPQIIAKDVVKAVLEQLPKAITREIGFKAPAGR